MSILPARSPFHRFLFPACLAVIIVAADPSSIGSRMQPLPPASVSPGYAYLIDQLVLDGFDRTYLLAVFNDPRIQFLQDVLLINLVSRYIEEDYSRFTAPRSVSSARKFLSREASFLTKLEKRFEVDKEVIVAILLIESAFGKRTGTNTVFNVFATLSLAARPEIRSTMAEHIVIAYPHISRADIEKRARRKAKWAYQELKTLLTLTRQESIDVFKVKGSWAGAFGIAQFLPSSYMRFALDGNNDRKVRLHNRYDAMVSVANYLKSYGWRMDLPDPDKRMIIRKYNNSSAYTEAVLNLSRMIAGS